MTVCPNFYFSYPQKSNIFHVNCVPVLRNCFFFKILYLYSHLSVLGLHFCTQTLIAVSDGYSLVEVRDLLIVVASLVVDFGL